MSRLQSAPTNQLCGPEFFASHTVEALRRWPDRALGEAGRLTHPMIYDGERDRYRPVLWDEAGAVIATALNGVSDPHEVEFFSAGKTSNEAAFLYQLFARRLGTNNLPICLNTATSLGLESAIGAGRATCRLKDFDLADAIFIFGQNPNTTPRRLAERLRGASARGARIVSFDPLGHGEQDGASELRPGEAFQPRIGGDAAAITGVIKALLEADATALPDGRPTPVDREFVERHTVGLDELAASARSQDWEVLERTSGLSRTEMQRAAAIYSGAERAILVYGMGITQHRDGVDNVRQIVNLALIRGNIGKPGAGVCPVAGHSFVTGVGVVSSPPPRLMEAIEARYGFRTPREPGHDLVHALQAMIDGRSRVCLSLGGNIARSCPDQGRVQAALAAMDLTVHISTRLNRSHLTHGRTALILPCLERDEAYRDGRALQSTTSEDFLSEVRPIIAKKEPASGVLKGETEIIALLASATFGRSSGPDWNGLARNHAAIRDEIAALFPGFRNYNARLDRFGAFRLKTPARGRVWRTPSGKATFATSSSQPADAIDDATLSLTTLRSARQDNTTPLADPFGRTSAQGRRDVIFLNRRDMQSRGLEQGDRVEVIAISSDGVDRRVTGLTVVARDMAAGCCAAYFPETNALVSLDTHDRQSLTPSFKSVPVRIMKLRRAERRDGGSNLERASPFSRQPQSRSRSSGREIVAPKW